MTEAALAIKDNEQRFMFQFVEAQTGKRTEPFVTDWDELAGVLRKSKEEQKDDEEVFPGDKDYILLVAVLDGQHTKIPANPLITVKTFLEAHGEYNDE